MPVTRAARAALRGLLASLLLVATLAPAATPQPVRAADAPDPSDIVIALDLSGSILSNEGIRTAFADALEGISDRTEAIAGTLVEGDVTVSMVVFATVGTPVEDCTNLSFRDDPEAVAQFAACLDEVAGIYAAGGSAQLVEQIGDDTNYVSAMEEASALLPQGSTRPAIIFFTDGRHEADGVPVGEVVPARERLFGDRTPFGFLPVGLGVDPDDRPTLEAGLEDLRITRELERCEGGPLDWPTVVFDSPEAAGQAVGVALQDVSCSFTVAPSPGESPTPAPTPAPTPEPTPAPTPGPTVGGIRLVPGDGRLEVQWTAPRDASAVTDYAIRCRPTEGGPDVESTEGVSTETSTVIEGLPNGVEHTCEVAAVTAAGVGEYVAASSPAAPFGPPPAPSKPSVQPGNEAARVSVELPGSVPVTGYSFECSADGGATWSVRRDLSGNVPSADVGPLVNGTEYVCRATAINDNGPGDPSPVSDAFRPCAGVFECNPMLLPLLGAGLVAMLLAFVFYVLRVLAGRRVWVTAQVDFVPTVTLGRGPYLGMKLVRGGPSRRVVEVAPATGSDAEVKIRFAGGTRFTISAAQSKVTVEAGHTATFTDARGQVHSIVLGAFDQEPSSFRRAEA